MFFFSFFRLIHGLTSCRKSLHKRKEEVQQLKMSYTAYRKSFRAQQQNLSRGGGGGGGGAMLTDSSSSSSDPFSTPSQTPTKEHGGGGHQLSRPMVPVRSGAGSFGSSVKKRPGGERLGLPRFGTSSSSSVLYSFSQYIILLGTIVAGLT